MKLLKKLQFGEKQKEKTPKEPEEKETKKTELEIVCADDPEAYEALYTTMFLYPWKIKESIGEVAEKGDYAIAGGLAIYKGDVEKVKEYFSKYAELTGKRLKILEIPERAVKKAQEYYVKYPETLSVKKK